MHDYSKFKGNVIINNCIFDSISDKPSIVVGEVVYNEITLVIINNTFINVNVAGEQNNYTYESDTVKPTKYKNNIVNGIVENTLKNIDTYNL